MSPPGSLKISGVFRFILEGLENIETQWRNLWKRCTSIVWKIILLQSALFFLTTIFIILFFFFLSLFYLLYHLLIPPHIQEFPVHFDYHHQFRQHHESYSSVHLKNPLSLLTPPPPPLPHPPKPRHQSTPQSSHHGKESAEAFLLFLSSPLQSSSLSSPLPSPPSLFSSTHPSPLLSSPKHLLKAHKYAKKISLSFSLLPHSRNRAQNDPVMLTIELFDQKGAVLGNSTRPYIVRDSTILDRAFQIFLFPFFNLFGIFDGFYERIEFFDDFMGETHQKISPSPLLASPLFSSPLLSSPLYSSTSPPTLSAPPTPSYLSHVVVHMNPPLLLKDVKLTFHTKFSGLSYLLFHFPFLSSLLFASLGALNAVVVLLSVFFIWRLITGTSEYPSGGPPALEGEREDEEDGGGRKDMGGEERRGDERRDRAERRERGRERRRRLHQIQDRHENSKRSQKENLRRRNNTGDGALISFPSLSSLPPLITPAAKENPSFPPPLLFSSRRRRQRTISSSSSSLLSASPSSSSSFNHLSTPFHPHQDKENTHEFYKLD